MILLDSDVMIDLLRQYPPAMQWFDALDEDEELALPGYVVMELIQGCRNKGDQERLQRAVAPYGTVWLSPTDCHRALEVFTQYHYESQCGFTGRIDWSDSRSTGGTLVHVQPETLSVHLVFRTLSKGLSGRSQRSDHRLATDIARPE